MVKVEIEIPDQLLREAKRIAREYNMSFAGVVRRGLEEVAPAYPPRFPNPAVEAKLERRVKRALSRRKPSP